MRANFCLPRPLTKVSKGTDGSSAIADFSGWTAILVETKALQWNSWDLSLSGASQKLRITEAHATSGVQGILHGKLTTTSPIIGGLLISSRGWSSDSPRKRPSVMARNQGQIPTFALQASMPSQRPAEQPLHTRCRAFGKTNLTIE